MAAKNISATELINSHKPKYCNYSFQIKDESLYDELEKEEFNLDELDTIQNGDLIKEALNAEFEYHERTVIGKAKEPTILQDGLIISKKLITKADKKLSQIGIGFFTYNDLRYVVYKYEYERFDVIEIFILT